MEMTDRTRKIIKVLVRIPLCATSFIVAMVALALTTFNLQNITTNEPFSIFYLLGSIGSFSLFFICVGGVLFVGFKIFEIIDDDDYE